MKHAVMLILEKEGRFLFVKRQKQKPAGGYWCPVSGRLESGETQAQAVVREANEEVGLRVRPVANVGAMPCSTGEFMLHWWTAEVLEGEARVAAPDEIEEVRWVHPRDFEKLDPHFVEDTLFIKSRMRLFDSFEEFWPYYLLEHRNKVSKWLHFIGTSLALLSVVAGILFWRWAFAVAPIAGYGFAWTGHFFFEHNKPATFWYPFWSLRGDFKMWAEMFSGWSRGRS